MTDRFHLHHEDSGRWSVVDKHALQERDTYDGGDGTQGPYEQRGIQCVASCRTRDEATRIIDALTAHEALHETIRTRKGDVDVY